MKEIKYKEIVKSTDGLIKNTEFIGFDQDYYIIQTLLRNWNPGNVFEIGTCTGNGSRIIRHVLPSARIMTLDISICGNLCPTDVEKIVHDSMTFNYSEKYPIDCWFIDGDHVYKNVFHETKEAIKSQSKYIIYHDADIEEVLNGIIDAFGDDIEKYELYRVIEPDSIYSSSGKNITRIVYAIKVK